jgi:hypothetical protein
MRQCKRFFLSRFWILWHMINLDLLGIIFAIFYIYNCSVNRKQIIPRFTCVYLWIINWQMVYKGQLYFKHLFLQDLETIKLFVFFCRLTMAILVIYLKSIVVFYLRYTFSTGEQFDIIYDIFIFSSFSDGIL